MNINNSLADHTRFISECKRIPVATQAVTSVICVGVTKRVGVVLSARLGAICG